MLSPVTAPPRQVIQAHASPSPTAQLHLHTWAEHIADTTAATGLQACSIGTSVQVGQAVPAHRGHSPVVGRSIPDVWRLHPAGHLHGGTPTAAPAAAMHSKAEAGEGEQHERGAVVGQQASAVWGQPDKACAWHVTVEDTEAAAAATAAALAADSRRATGVAHRALCLARRVRAGSAGSARFAAAGRQQQANELQR